MSEHDKMVLLDTLKDLVCELSVDDISVKTITKILDLLGYELPE